MNSNGQHESTYDSRRPANGRQAGPSNREPRESGTIALRNPKRRIQYMGLSLAIVFSIYFARLFVLQIIEGPRWAAEAAKNQLVTFNVPAIRGSITDVNGRLIATTVLARHVIADQTQIKDIPGTAKAIAEITGEKKATIQKALTGKKKFSYVVKAITPDQWDQIRDLDLPGLYSERTTIRNYPAGKLAASVIGFVGGEEKGLAGIEYSLNDLLAGKNGKETIELVKGREIPTGARYGEPSVDGTSVRLTLDEDIQAMAERVLVDRLKSAKATSGSVVVLDPKTGDILAMATAPSYDPGNTRNIELKDLRNPAIQDAFEPGSTAKVMTMAAVIEEGAATPKTKFTIPKRLKRADRYFKDHDDHGVLKLTLNGVLAKSSNMGSILAAEKIGDKKFVSYLKKFGIGESTGLNLPGESSGFIPDMKDPNQWSGTTFPTLAFGQGLSVSAVQVASVYATIANNGVRVAPRIIAGYTDADGEYTETEPSKKTRVISATTAKTVREMLESVVSKDGTAPQAQIPGYRVAGKTGTANKFSEETGGYSGYTASFIGMAPAEDPALVVAVSINTPGGEHYGSLVSGPVFRDVMSYALAKGKIAPSITKRPSMAVEW